MGVLNTADRERRGRLLNDFIPGDDAIPVDDDISTPGATHRRHCRTTAAKTSKVPRPQSHIKNTGRKARGGANSRKYDNFVFLSELIESDEFDELNIADFMVKSGSAFELLFEDESQMNKWSEFVSMKEDEQERYLCEIAGVSLGNSESSSQKMRIESDLKNASKCFQKVDNKIKTTLKNRNISLAGLKFFEEELLSFFMLVDEGVMVSLIPSSMDRLLVHGICQYMNLTSSSLLKSIIQVENLRSQFQPPEIPLSQYLQRIR